MNNQKKSSTEIKVAFAYRIILTLPNRLNIRYITLYLKIY